MARIAVSDDGPGLTGEQIRTLIEPFARGEQSRNRATGGAGLGLSIARDIAEGEGGSLPLSNRPGGGLAAVIALPVHEKSAIPELPLRPGPPARLPTTITLPTSPGPANPTSAPPT